nr:MAG: ORF1 [TTV-like mini virus]
MPWRRRYYNKRRRYWLRYRRPRKTFWRRRRRRRPWYPVRRKKLKSIIVREFQPSCIRKCKVKGLIPLFWGPIERFVNNYELYEMTPAPEKLPSGGLFSIKNFTLEGLFSEHQYCRNIWTQTNTDLPLVRYTGCKFKFYHSENTDYIVTHDNSLPMTSNLEMYETMHPGIHGMLRHKLIVSKKHNNQKPYRILKIKPPNPLQNKWYFQVDIAKVPLCQIRTSATSFDEYYINYKNISTTMTITYLNPGAINNTCFKFNETSGYWARKLPNSETKVYLYTTTDNSEIKQGINFNKIIFLGQTQINTAGVGMIKGQSGTPLSKYDKTMWGNPFYKKYLQKTQQIYFSTLTISQLANKYLSSDTLQETEAQQFTITNLTEAFRYNPFRDQGKNNKIFLKSVKEYTTEWKPPESADLQQYGLPLWVLSFGFVDFEKKLKKAKDIDTDYMVVIESNYESPEITKTYPIIDPEFIQGKSPFENGPNEQDNQRWYPCTQYQQTILNNISLSGPGSPKPPPLQAIQAKAEYCFYFKWGGNLPPMEALTDPANQKHYHIPTMLTQTTSLQNPTTRPESLLYSFDERRGQLTDRAIKRLRKDWETKEIPFKITERFQPTIQAKEETTSESSSSEEDEEETETLLLKLKQQRLKHQQLKLRILEHLKLQKKSE